MKRVIIPIAVVIMLMGGGISVMKTFKIGPFAPVPTANGEAKAPEPEKNLEPVIVALEPLTIPVFQGDKIATTVTMEVHLEVLGPKKAAEAKKMLPKIADTFLRDLHAYLPRLVETQGELDVEVILARLNGVAKKAPVTKDLVNRVLIQAISDTPSPPGQ